MPNQIKIYTTENLKELDNNRTLTLEGKVSGPAVIHNKRGILAMLSRQIHMGFFLDNQIFCYEHILAHLQLGLQKQLLRDTAWVNSNIGKTIYLEGHYKPKEEAISIHHFYKNRELDRFPDNPLKELPTAI